eukprot:s4619_g6.t1
MELGRLRPGRDDLNLLLVPLEPQPAAAHWLKQATRDVAQAERWSPCWSRRPRQEQTHGVQGREREASEQQDAEVRRWDDDWRGRGERREDTGHMRSCLREQQRTRRRIEVRKVRLAGALITSSVLPPTQGCGAAAAEVSPPKWSGEACPPDLGGGWARRCKGRYASAEACARTSVSSPVASGSAVSERLAAERSPRWTSTSARATLLSTSAWGAGERGPVDCPSVREASRRRVSHSPRLPCILCTHLWVLFARLAWAYGRLRTAAAFLDLSHPAQSSWLLCQR